MIVLDENIPEDYATASGTKTRHTAPERIGRVEVAVPPLANQRKIAEMLTAYDDLTENNRRRMALLEETTRQLYLEWFVRLRCPGHEHTRITNGVPEGWGLKKLIELCESVDYGYTASADQEEAGPNFLRITDIVPEFIDISLERLIEESKEDCYAVLQARSNDWHDGKHDLLPWLNSFLAIVRRAYVQFEERAGHIKSPRGAKAALIEAAVNGFVGEFGLSDGERVCPGVSRDMVRQCREDEGGCHQC